VRSVEIDELSPPGVLAAVGLETVDPDLFDQVAALLGPPPRRAVVREVGHE
jgi:hypothetical protein